MDEKIINDTVDTAEVIGEEELSEVAGGKGSGKHVQIVGCKHNCNVRSSANSKSDDNIIGKANLGDRYKFYGWHGNWAKIQYGSQTGYVFIDFVSIV